MKGMKDIESGQVVKSIQHKKSCPLGEHKITVQVKDL